MSENSDATTAAAEGADGDVGQLPHFAFRAGGVRPPIKPALMTKSDRPMTAPSTGTLDRLPVGGFVLQPARRITEIPSSASVKAAEAEVEGKRLIVGRQVRINGEISGCHHLVVEGAVDANLEGVHDVEVSTTGILKGSADVGSAVVAGVFEGALTVRTHLDVAATGHVRGQISYRSITVATGGKITGTVSEISD